LDEIGVQLDTSEVLPTIVPIAEQWEGEAAVAIELPGLPKNALQLTLSGDELIVRVGTYPRHSLLPEGRRGITRIKDRRASERPLRRHAPAHLAHQPGQSSPEHDAGVLEGPLRA